MKKIAILTAALALIAGSAFAAGIDLSVNACAGNTGATNDAGALDCAGGAMFTILGTWGPAEAVTDLSNMDWSLDMQVGADLGTGAAFWNFDQITGCNSAALNSSQGRASAGCSTPNNYLNVWNVSGSGTAVGGGQRGPQIERIFGTCARPSAVSVTANQKLFGFQLFIDLSVSPEAGGGSCVGCTVPGCIVWNSGFPGNFSNSPMTTLDSPFLGSNVLSFNGGAALCGAVPAKKHTWGQLKSLYR